MGRLSKIRYQSYFVLKNMDLKGISKLTYQYAGATVEVRTDSPKGRVIATLDYTPTGGWDKFVELSTSMQGPGGKHDLYFVFVKKTCRLCTWVLSTGYVSKIDLSPSCEAKADARKPMLGEYACFP